MLEENISKMNHCSCPGYGMDIIIISTTTPQQEKYWEKRLLKMQGHIVRSDTIVLAVVEDWPSRAGNGLGTLYAYQKAREKALKLYHIDIFEKQKEGASIAIYHTAGQGTRLAPLTTSEYSIKPAVKLPCLIGDDEVPHLLTLLEAVIKQTSIYASSRRGRLAVFWGDQIFIPEKSSDYTPMHHIDIMALIGKMPSREKWKEHDMDNYGLIAIDQNGEGIAIDKSNYDTILSLIEDKIICVEGGIGKSLGNFSLSSEMTFALLQEFSEELERKEKPMDSDPHFWMPTTLDRDTYLMLLKRKNVPRDIAEKHYDRMQSFKKNFITQHSHLGYFGALDTGEYGCWWDYGTIDSYYKNTMKLTGKGQETTLMRLFYNLPLEFIARSTDELEVDETSCLVNSTIRSGRVKNSILIGVQADHLDISDSILLNVSVKNLQGQKCLLYNVFEEEPLIFDEGTIRADVFLPNHHKQIKLTTFQGRDGKADWYTRLPWNHLSYEDMYEITISTDLENAHKFAHDLYPHYP
jgi:hypothetical protein